MKETVKAHTILHRLDGLDKMDTYAAYVATSNLISMAQDLGERISPRRQEISSRISSLLEDDSALDPHVSTNLKDLYEEVNHGAVDR